MYWEDGGQVPPAVSDEITKSIEQVEFFNTKTTDFDGAVESGMLKVIGGEVDEAYINAVYKQAINKDAVARVGDKFKLIYTPSRKRKQACKKNS